MKLFWHRRPSPAEVAESIAALERELGIDDQTVLAEVEERKLERFNSRRGAVILDKFGPAPVRRGNPDLIDWKPGAKFPVADHNYVNVIASAYALSATGPHNFTPPPSRVVLPAGVRV